MGDTDNLHKLENLADDLLYHWESIPFSQQQTIREEYPQFVNILEEIQTYLINQ